MDVDTLNVEKINEMMKKGLCFRCEKPGHLSRDCPNKGKPAASTSSTAPPSYSPPKKMGGKELYTHIRSLTALMSQEEKMNFTKKPKKRVFELESRLDVALSNTRYLLCNISHDQINSLSIPITIKQTSRSNKQRITKLLKPLDSLTVELEENLSIKTLQEKKDSRS